MNEEEVLQGQMTIFDYIPRDPADSLCGKMSRVQQTQTSETITASSWKNWQGSAKKPSLFLCLKTENGQLQDALSGTDGALLGASQTHNILYHNEDEESVLSQILTAIAHKKSCSINNSEAPNNPKKTKLREKLERNVDKRFNLSKKAANGILDRANSRKKKLPPILGEALRQIVNLD